MGKTAYQITVSEDRYKDEFVFDLAQAYDKFNDIINTLEKYKLFKQTEIHDSLEDSVVRSGVVHLKTRNGDDWPVITCIKKIVIT